MKSAEQLKEVVREKYGEIASQSGSCGCCGDSGKTKTNDVLTENYSRLEGYNPDADLQLGCGIPTKFARIAAGDTVVDLGSGAGNDCFVARALTGEKGKVIGVDFTEAMIAKAKSNAARLGYHNVEFTYGDIENIPLPEGTADVVVSNCVMNLVPDKRKAFSETYRILKKGGHFSISDIVLSGELPEGLKDAAALYAGCISGAVDMDEYLSIIQYAGFRNVTIQKKTPTPVPEEVMRQYISPSEIEEYRQSGKGIFSITVYAEK